MGEVTQPDMFTISTVDPPWRDNRDVMEYPFLSLQKNRRKPIEYKDDRVWLSVGGDVRFQIATIWDWDLIIFAASHLNDGLESGLTPSPWIEFAPHDCLRQIGRTTGGKDYRELAAALRRLRTTTVITDIRLDDGAGVERPFSWVEDYRIPKRYQLGRMQLEDRLGEVDPTRPWAFKLPDWLYNAILRQRDILAVHHDYFGLTGGLERWLYRLARKAVPDRGERWWIDFRMETLHKRSGTSRPVKKFAFDMRRIAEENRLPEYGVEVTKEGRNQRVTLYKDRGKEPRLARGHRRRMIEARTETK